MNMLPRKNDLINKLKKCDENQIVTFDPLVDTKLNFFMGQLRMMLQKWSNLTVIIIKNI